MTYLELFHKYFFSFNRFQHGQHEVIPCESSRGGSVGVVRLTGLAPLDDVVRLFHGVVGPLDTSKAVHDLDGSLILLIILVIVVVCLRNRVWVVT